MIKAYVRAAGYPDDQIEVQELPALPSSGSGLSVIDRNANAHHLRVTDVRIRGLGIGPDHELSRSIAGDVHVTVFGRHDSDWSREMRR